MTVRIPSNRIEAAPQERPRSAITPHRSRAPGVPLIAAAVLAACSGSSSDTTDAGPLRIYCAPGQHPCDGRCVENTALATCVTSCTPCTAPEHGVPACNGFACRFSCAAGYLRAGDACVPRTSPRPLAPLSTATVTSRRPTLHWELAPGSDGAHVELCRDRACTLPIASFDAAGTSGRPADDLPTGTVFWRLRSRSAGTTAADLSPTWQFRVGARSAPVDTSWGTSLDLDGDGYDEVAVGAASANVGDSTAGTVYVFRGGARGPQATPVASFTGPRSPLGQDAGHSLAAAGDLNGDGYGDLAVGAPRIPSGQTFVFFGGPGGIHATPDLTLSIYDHSLDEAGWAVASLGDVNGDGYGDLAVARSIDVVYLYLGSDAGPIGLQTELPVHPETLPPAAASLSVGGATDLNGDGFADFAAAWGPEIYLFMGARAGVATTPTVTFRSPLDLTRYVVQAGPSGDVNGDGYGDLVVGSTDQPVEFVGGPGAPGRSSQMLLARGDAGSVGDLDGDGYGDVVAVQSVFDPDMGRQLCTLRGLPSGPAMMGACTVPSDVGVDFGAVLAWGDVNGDGLNDLIASANAVHRAYVYFGSGAGLAGSTTTLTVPEAPPGFGFSVASGAGPLSRPVCTPLRHGDQAATLHTSRHG